MPSPSSSSNALGLAGVGTINPSQITSSASQSAHKDFPTARDTRPDQYSVAPLNESEVTEFPFPRQTSTSTPTLHSHVAPSAHFPQGHEHTPSTNIADLLSNWNAFTPSPGPGQFGSLPELHELVSPDEALPLSDLIREEYIDTSQSQNPSTYTPAKPSPCPPSGLGGLHLTPPDADELRILNSARATSPFSPAYRPGKSLFNLTRSVSSTDTRPSPPIPQRQLSWSKTASAHLQAQIQGGRRFSVPNSQEAKGKLGKASFTDPRYRPSHPLSRSRPRPERQESLPSAGVNNPQLDDVFAPQYQLAGLGPLPSTNPFFRYPRSTPPATLAKPKPITRKAAIPTVQDQCGLKLLSETATRSITDHQLPPQFTARYLLGDELGVGGFGFVCSALVIDDVPTTPTGSFVLPPGTEVAVKFVFKDRIWRKTKEMIGGWPIEAYVLKMCHHPNIITFYELYEDEKFFYLVQELHGDPWAPDQTLESTKGAANQASSVPATPFSPPRPSTFGPLTQSPVPLSPLPLPTASPSAIGYDPDGSPTLSRRPIMARRASHDLFEAVEHQRFTEEEAKFIFKQIVSAVVYLHKRKIFHRDLKDENIVIDRNLKIKIVDFGSAVVEEEQCPPVLYDQFRGTIAYAAAEVLRGESYHADAVDIWSLGILLSILCTGESPFPDSLHAREGKIKPKHPMPPGPLDLMKRCLVPRPDFRISIEGVRDHYWLTGTPNRGFVLV